MEPWMLVDKGAPVHIAALFSDPGIVDKRHVRVVLDLRLGQMVVVSRLENTVGWAVPGSTARASGGYYCGTGQRGALSHSPNGGL